MSAKNTQLTDFIDDFDETQPLDETESGEATSAVNAEYQVPTKECAHEWCDEQVPATQWPQHVKDCIPSKQSTEGSTDGI